MEDGASRDRFSACASMTLFYSYSMLCFVCLFTFQKSKCIAYQLDINK